MADLAHRRIVTGLDDSGRSSVVIDGPIPVLADISAALAWRCDIPADNSGSEDTVAPYAIEMLHSGQANFAICTFPAGSPEIMHATDTIDYLVIISGRVTLVLEKGEADLGPGDFIVDRGVMHGWRNPHDEDCIAAVVNLPAHPVGNGRTI
ncbi:MAG: cupin domain-containing protein [Novosphingobium sp.]|nr:cupin domain-containing protein [Novosphingobium sp.]MCP5403373.1 cupin domain-containing protein [Novosphingobium sp.]